MNKKIKSLFSGRPKCRDTFSNRTSHPCGEWNPTNISVNKIIMKALALSLRPYTTSSIKDFKTAISLRLINMTTANATSDSKSEKTFLIASALS